MKISKSLLPNLIFCVESLMIICSSPVDLNIKKISIAKYHKYILNLTKDIKETFNIVMTCILGDGHKILSKLRSNLN